MWGVRIFRAKIKCYLISLRNVRWLRVEVQIICPEPVFFHSKFLHRGFCRVSLECRQIAGRRTSTLELVHKMNRLKSLQIGPRVVLPPGCFVAKKHSSLGQSVLFSKLLLVLLLAYIEFGSFRLFQNEN